MNSIEHSNLPSLARKHGIDLRTLKSRLGCGMPLKEALNKLRRSYPNGVRRPRETKHKAISVMQLDLPRCDRCKLSRRLSSVFGNSWLLCGVCREQLVQIAANWVNRP
jgi:hypothetical protein